MFYHGESTFLAPDPLSLSCSVCQKPSGLWQEPQADTPALQWAVQCFLGFLTQGFLVKRSFNILRSAISIGSKLTMLFKKLRCKLQKKEQESWSGRGGKRQKICSSVGERGEGVRLARLKCVHSELLFSSEFTTFMCLSKTSCTKYHQKGPVFGLSHAL